MNNSIWLRSRWWSWCWWWWWWWAGGWNDYCITNDYDWLAVFSFHSSINSFIHSDIVYKVMWRGNHETKNYFVIFYRSFMVGEDVFSLMNFSIQMKNGNKKICCEKIIITGTRKFILMYNFMMVFLGNETRTEHQ